MPLGYCGKILRVNLRTRNIIVEELEEKVMRKYFGGKGLISYYLMREVNPKIEPLGEDNKLIFATGVMTGLPVPGMIRFAVGAKSPLTGGYGQAEAGGFWGPELKMAGFDAVIIEGKASKPVYLFIKDEEVQIKEADHIWGKDIGESQSIIRKENNDSRIRIAQIGQGGENQVLYACIINELKHVNGRGGLGAVMGSKNLKAIAVRGTKKVEYHDKDKVMEIGKWYNTNLFETPLMYGLHNEGTAISVDSLNKSGILPTRNFREGYFESAESLSGAHMNNTILKKREGCYACSIKCKRVVEVNRDDFKVDPKFGGPEYETIGAFGSLCGVSDLEIVAKANEMCNKYTIDTISTGVSIAFAMECYENGIISKVDTDGLELKFGNGNVVLKLIEMIAKREGIGNILADGTQRAAQVLGHGAEKFAMTVKNQELPLHDPRGKLGVGIQYAISDTGADHMQAPHDPMLSAENYHFQTTKALGINEPFSPMDLGYKKIRNLYLSQLVWSFYNIAGVCQFTPAPRGLLSFKQFEELMQVATGWNVSLWEMMKASERVLTMSRMYNLACGFTSKDDKLPDRLYEPLENGALKGVGIDYDKFQDGIKTYYRIAGWNEETGIPLVGKMMELDIDAVQPVEFLKNYNVI